MMPLLTEPESLLGPDSAEMSSLSGLKTVLSQVMENESFTRH